MSARKKEVKLTLINFVNQMLCPLAKVVPATAVRRKKDLKEDFAIVAMMDRSLFCCHMSFRVIGKCVLP